MGGANGVTGVPPPFAPNRNLPLVKEIDRKQGVQSESAVLVGVELLIAKPATTWTSWRAWSKPRGPKWSAA
jgi:hypothetical protein